MSHQVWLGKALIIFSFFLVVTNMSLCFVPCPCENIPPQEGMRDWGLLAKYTFRPMDSS